MVDMSTDKTCYIDDNFDVAELVHTFFSVIALAACQKLLFSHCVKTIYKQA